MTKLKIEISTEDGMNYETVTGTGRLEDLKDAVSAMLDIPSNYHQEITIKIKPE